MTPRFTRSWRFKHLAHHRKDVLNILLPRNLTWNLKMMVSKRNLLFQGLLSRSHVKFQGCIWYFPHLHTCSIFQMSFPWKGGADLTAASPPLLNENLRGPPQCHPPRDFGHTNGLLINHDPWSLDHESLNKASSAIVEASTLQMVRISQFLMSINCQRALPKKGTLQKRLFYKFQIVGTTLSYFRRKPWHWGAGAPLIFITSGVTIVNSWLLNFAVLLSW